MRPALYQSGFAPRDAPAAQRGFTLAVVVALHALLLLMLLRLAPPAVPPTVPTAPLTVDLLPEAEVAPERTRSEKEAQPQSGAARPKEAPVTPPARPETPPPPTPLSNEPSIWSKVIPLTRQEMAAADISRFPSRAAQPGAGAGESGEGRESGDTAEAGRAPNGERLYAAQWYRKPTRAELSTYMPAGAPREGWGVIACETVADYRVDNCVELGQSPPGSGLSRAVREAAWQFRVLPPRVGGRKLVGAWVRIRIEYSSERIE